MLRRSRGALWTSSDSIPGLGRWPDLAHGGASYAPWLGVARCWRQPAVGALRWRRTMAWPDPANHAEAITNASLPTRRWSVPGTATGPPGRPAAPTRGATARMTPGAAGQTSASAARAQASPQAAPGWAVLAPQAPSVPAILGSSVAPFTPDWREVPASASGAAKRAVGPESPRPSSTGGQTMSNAAVGRDHDYARRRHG
jgi:hypothetical protein